MLLDVLLGHGSHPDPVGELLPVLAGAAVPVVVSLIARAATLSSWRPRRDGCMQAGASVFTSNAAATRHALSLLISGGPSRNERGPERMPAMSARAKSRLP